MSVKRQVVLNFDDPITATIRDLLLSHGAEPGSIFTAWRFSGTDIPKAVESALSQFGTEFSTFFEYQPQEAGSLDGTAAYLWLDDFDDAASGNNGDLLAYHNEASSFVANKSLAARISSIGHGLQWTEWDKELQLYKLEKVPELPEPVIVPRVISASEGSGGKWAVQSDGREFLTERNLAIVSRSGIAWTSHCAAGGSVLKWNRPAIFSGRILSLFSDGAVGGADGIPVFLGPSADDEHHR